VHLVGPLLRRHTDCKITHAVNNIEFANTASCERMEILDH